MGRESPKHARSAVQEYGEDHSADDQQERLRQDDDAGDEQSEAEPDRGALQLADYRGVANSAGPGRSTCGSIVAGSAMPIPYGL